MGDLALSETAVLTQAKEMQVWYIGEDGGTAALYLFSITKLASPLRNEAKAEAGSWKNRKREKGH